MSVTLKHFLSILLFISIFSSVRGVETVSQFLKVAGSTRQTSLGGAYTGVMGQVDAIGANPATISSINNLNTFFTFAPYFEGVNYFKGAFVNKFKFGTLGLQFTGWDSGSIEATTVNSLGKVSKTGKTFGFSGQAIGINFANTYFWKMPIGAQLKLVREDMATRTFNTVAVDLGTQRAFFKNKLTTGFSILNLGIPKPTADGTSVEQLPLTFSLGAAYKAWSIRNHALSLFTDTGYAIDEGFTLHHGVEYLLYELVFVRLGFQPLSREEKFSAGLGIKVASGNSDYQFDYAFKSNATFGSTNHFTFKVSYKPSSGSLAEIKENLDSGKITNNNKKLDIVFYRIIMKDGTDLTGKVVYENEQKVVLEVEKFGTVVARRKNIDKITKLQPPSKKKKP